MRRIHTRTWIVLLVLGILLLGVALYLLPGRVPWVPGGTIVLAIRAVPDSLGSDTQFGIGLDDIILHTEDGDEIGTHLFQQRVLLRTGETTLTPLLSIRVPNGSYRGVSLRVRSPEIRNDWQGDVPPQAVSLLHEELYLPIPFAVTEDQTTAIILGIETMQAIHQDGDKGVYLPVIQVETRTDALVTDTEDIPFTIEGGAITGSATYGMSWDGTVAQNVRAPLERPATGGVLRDEFASEHSEQQTSLDSSTDTLEQTDAITTDETATTTDGVTTNTEEVGTSTGETTDDTDTGVAP